MSENNLSNHSKSRVMMLLAIAAVVVGGLVFVWRHAENKRNAQATVSVSSAPSIQSVPGAGDPSNQYVQDQNLQNQLDEEKARKSATSAVPTITRSSFVGNPDEFAQDSSTDSSSTTMPGQCPLKKVVVMFKPNPASCTVENLKMARKTGVTAEELACQGCSCPALKLAGYTSGDLKDVGYTAKQLKNCGFTIDQLVAAGFNARDLKDAGFTAKDLANAGFTPGEINQAFSGAPENSGLSAAQLAAKGLSAEELKKEGFSAAELKGPITAAELKAHGVSAAQLKKMGFTAAQLKAAGFTDGDLKKAGFTDQEIQAAKDALTPKSGISGLSASQLAKKGLNAAELKKDGFTAAQLKAAGFSDADLKAAGFTPKEVIEASKIAPGTAGLSAAELKAHGLTAAQLKKMGFTAAQLKAAGFSAKALKDAGFSAKDLRDAGFGASALKAAGFTPTELKAAGFTAGQLKGAGFTPDELKAAGFTAKDLRDAGFTAAQLHAAGFPASELSAAGFTRGDLLRAGYTPEEAGYANKTSKVPTVDVPNIAQTGANASFGSKAANGSNGGNGGNGSNAGMPSMTANTPEARLAEVARLQQQQMNAQQRQDYIAQQQNAMTMQAQKLLAGWSNHSNQSLAQAPKDKSTTNATAGNGLAGGVGAPIIKAGTVLFAVLDTGINSDNNSPIMAHVVTGALKGAKLLGKFVRTNDRVVLSFYLVNDPRYSNSIPINAVAIDPDTAHTAMAGSVNYHYLLRYGTLFASAFVQGLSDAVIANHSVTTCLVPGFGCTTTPNQNMTTGQIAAVAAGNVGEQYANRMSSNFNTPPTVKVQAGSGLGILFMNDVQMPVPTAPTSNNTAAVKNQLIGLNRG